MKVTGPGTGPSPDTPPGASDVAPTGPADAAFAEALDAGADPTHATDPSRAAARTGGTTAAAGVDLAAAVSDIGAALAAGSITPQDAVNRLIDRILDRQLGAAAPTHVRDQVATALRQVIEVDPVLSAQLQRLGR